MVRTLQRSVTLPRQITSCTCVCSFVAVLLCVGLGIGLQFHRQLEEHSPSLTCRIATVMLAVSVAQGSEFIPLPAQLPMLLFYLLVAAKIATVIFLTVMVGFLTGANNNSSSKIH